MELEEMESKPVVGNREAVTHGVIGLIARQQSLDVSLIDASTGLEHPLGFDSLTMYELLLDIEHVFGVMVPAKKMDGVVTVGDLAKAIISCARAR